MCVFPLGAFVRLVQACVNRLGGLSLPRKSVVSLTDRPDMNLDVYRGRKPTIPFILVQACTFLS